MSLFYFLARQFQEAQLNLASQLGDAESKIKSLQRGTRVRCLLMQKTRERVIDRCGSASRAHIRLII